MFLLRIQFKAGLLKETFFYDKWLKNEELKYESHKACSNSETVVLGTFWIPLWAFWIPLKPMVIGTLNIDRKIFKLKQIQFLGGHHLHIYDSVCLCVIEKKLFRGYSNKFPRRNDFSGLKVSLHIKIGVTRWKMVKINFGVPPPQKKNK